VLHAPGTASYAAGTPCMDCVVCEFGIRLATGLGTRIGSGKVCSLARKLHVQMMSAHGVVQALGQQAADLPPLLNASEVRCFEREGLPVALQLSAFPALEETGVRYFRGSIRGAQVLPEC
jgi:hypothetical protein